MGHATSNQLFNGNVLAGVRVENPGAGRNTPVAAHVTLAASIGKNLLVGLAGIDGDFELGA